MRLQLRLYLSLSLILELHNLGKIFSLAVYLVDGAFAGVFISP